MVPAEGADWRPVGIGNTLKPVESERELSPDGLSYTGKPRSMNGTITKDYLRDVRQHDLL